MNELEPEVSMERLGPGRGPRNYARQGAGQAGRVVGPELFNINQVHTLKFELLISVGIS